MSDEKEYWSADGKPTEAGRICVSETLSALLPKEHHPVFTEIRNQDINARVFVGKHFLHFSVGFCRGADFGCTVSGYRRRLGEYLFLHAHHGDTLEKVIHCAFVAIWPQFLDMCSKIAEVECLLPNSTWKCLVCGAISPEKEEAESHCLENHPYSPPVKSAGKI